MVTDYNQLAANKTLAAELNLEKVPDNWTGGTNIQFPCQISNFTNGTYQKYPKTQTYVTMELTPFSDSLAKYLPEDLQANEGFVKYVKGTLYE
jgi:hypothetical protein